MKVVRIVWRDAHHIAAGEWLPPGFKPGVKVVTVGHYIGKHDGHHLIAHTRQDSGDLTGAFAIPVANVVRMKFLH